MAHHHYGPHLLRRAPTAEPAGHRPVPTKTISRVEVAVVAPAVADPAVLVRLHDDLRLCLDALAKHLDGPLGPYVVTSLATGVVVLARATEVGEPSPLGEFAPDARNRLRLTEGLRRRLAVPVGGQVLASAAPDAATLRLVNLAVIADLLAASAAQSPAGDDMGVPAKEAGSRRLRAVP